MRLGQDGAEDDKVEALMRRLLDTHILSSCSAVFGAFDESLLFKDKALRGAAAAGAYTRPFLSSTSAVLVTPPRLPLSNRLGETHAPRSMLTSSRKVDECKPLGGGGGGGGGRRRGGGAPHARRVAQGAVQRGVPKHQPGKGGNPKP